METAILKGCLLLGEPMEMPQTVREKTIPCNTNGHSVLPLCVFSPLALHPGTSILTGSKAHRVVNFL